MTGRFISKEEKQMSCGIELEANKLITDLTAGEDFTIPDVDLSGAQYQFPGGTSGALYKQVSPITLAELTERKVGGNGAFDALMDAMGAHLKLEFEKGRITGAEYTKAYTALAEGAMSNAVSFLINRDQAFWQAQNAQVQAITALVQLETAKVQLAAVQLEAQNQKANYALTKIRLAGESVAYCTAQFNLSDMLPAQLLLNAAQRKLISEQTEAQRAQTLDIRSDGAQVTGVLGKQKDLYAQQITSYQRDSENKAARLFTDAWITMKTIDEGLLPPSSFQNASVDSVLTRVKINNGLT